MPYYQQTSFNSGELSPRLRGRSDIERYKNGCRYLRNMLLQPHGAAKSRPGSKFIQETDTSTKKSRLIPFIFSNTQAYALEFGHLYIRFFYSGGTPILSAGVPYEVVSPYSETDLPSIQYAQTADVLYLVHPDYAVRKLTRFDHDSWTLTAVDWMDGPYLPENSDGVTQLRCSALTGTGVTMRANYTSGLLDMGTYDGTVGTPEDFLTAARPWCVFIFEAVKSNLRSVKINVTTAAGSATNARAYLYTSNGTRATGTSLGHSQYVDMSTTGEKTFTFSTGPYMAAGDDYAIVFGISATDTIQIDAVADDADYVSGYAATATGAVTNLAGVDWRIEIEYQPLGAASLFEAGHVGSLWRIRQSGETVRNQLAGVGQVTDTLVLRGTFYVDLTPNNVSPYWEGRVCLEKSYDQTFWYEVASFHYSTKQEFSEIETDVYYRCRCTHYVKGDCYVTISQNEHWAVAKITAIVSASNVLADIIVPLVDLNPSVLWREGSWSGVRGYPSAIVFDSNDRLCLAATDYQPYQLWASWVGDYEQMTPGDTDDSALDFCLSKLNNRVYWIEGADDALVGSAGEEARLLVQQQAPLSPSNPPKVLIQSQEGSALNMRPVQIGPAYLFVDGSKRQLVETAYSLETDSSVPNNLTLFSEHISESGFTEIAYQKKPDSILWCVRTDGLLAGLTYYRKENVLGWHLHDFGGVVESICCIPSSLGATAGHTELWMIVNRTIGGVTKRYVEMLADHESLTDPDSPVEYFCVDSGITYSGAAATVITGLDHLEGETVSILADGLVCPQQAVSSGQVTLEVAAETVHVGLPFQCILQPMVAELSLADGASLGRMRRITSGIFKLFRSLGGKYGESLTELHEIPAITPDTTLADTAGDLMTGDIDLPWAGDWSRDPAPMIVQDNPLPICVQCIMTQVVTSD